MKEAIHKRSYIVGFHLSGVSRIGDHKDRGGGGWTGRMRSNYSWAWGFLANENVLEVDYGIL